MRFLPDPTVRQQVERQAAFKRAVTGHAERAATQVRAVAPRGESGRYQRSIVVIDQGDTVAVASTDFAAHIVEWGSVNNPPYAPLRRGARAAGLDLKQDQK